ncbi:MAG: hypothetical protein K6G85_03990 [Eubacterium sp.]|nr:hypothetical protein [Eubacterium sp.]
MSGKELYQKTFDEINLSDRALAKLMLLNAGVVPARKSEFLLYRVFKAFVGFVGFLIASGTIFRIPTI